MVKTTTFDDFPSPVYSYTCILFKYQPLSRTPQVNKPKSLNASRVYENKKLCLTACLQYCILKQGNVLQGKAKHLDQMWRVSIYGTSACTLCSLLIVATSFFNCEQTTTIILCRIHNEGETKTDTTLYFN
jgi:hypothetical protein